MSDLKKTLWASSGLGRVLSRVKGFRRNESGAMVAFSLSIFIMMLWVGGIGIDLMRFEHERARMQYTLDRAALAAASMNANSTDCEAIAQDYFEKAGLDSAKFFVGGICDETSRKVLVSAETRVKSLFMNLIGVDELDAAGKAIAYESQQDIEISLVVDISGSMGWTDSTGTRSKLEALQEAASDFFDILLTGENRDRVSINIIPYNMQVNVGEDVLDQLNVTNEHSYSHCVDFESADFETVELTEQLGNAATLGDLSLFTGTSSVMGSADDLQRTGHFDPYYTTINHPFTTSDDNTSRLFVCSPEEELEVTLMSQNRGALKEIVNNLEAGGNTSTDIGVKWASYFLNESAEQVFDNLPDGSSVLTKDGQDPVDADGNPLYDVNGDQVEAPIRVPAVFEDRPYAYDRNNTKKIMVVMSDGQNTTQYQLDDDYASGGSDMYGHTTDGVTYLSKWMSYYKPQSGPDDYYISEGRTNTDYRNASAVGQGGGAARELDWTEVWNMMGIKYLAYYYYYAEGWQASQYWDFVNDAYDTVSGSQKDTRMLDACTAAKDEDVIIFTVGFEVSNHSAGILEQCASQPINFFRVEGTELEDAFGKIAGTIQRLKLTN
ncbi:MAG: VWA domain-containing protein [Pseudomonadota bacterium]